MRVKASKFGEGDEEADVTPSPLGSHPSRAERGSGGGAAGKEARRRAGGSTSGTGREVEAEAEGGQEEGGSGNIDWDDWDDQKMRHKVSLCVRERESGFVAGYPPLMPTRVGEM